MEKRADDEKDVYDITLNYIARGSYRAQDAIKQDITAKKRVKSIIDFMTDFKSIVKSTHDLTGKSCAFDLRLILLSNQL